MSIPTPTTLAPSLQTASTSVSCSYSVGASENVLLVGIHTRGNPVINSVSYGGTAMIREPGGDIASTGVTERVAVFSLVNPPTGSHSIVCLLATTPTQISIAALSAQVPNTGAALGPAAADSGVTTTATVSVAGTAAGDLVVGFVSTNGTFTSDAGQTSFGTPGSAANFNPKAAYKTATGDPTSVTWTSTLSRDWALVAIALKGTPPNHAPTVTINEANVELPLNASYPYTASADDTEDGGITNSIAWSVSDPAILAIPADSVGGAVTVKKIAAGSAQLLADVNDSNGTPATQASVTISDPATGAGFDQARFIIHALGGIV